MDLFKGFTILDERGNWYGPSIEVAKKRGYSTSRIFRGHEAKQKGSAGLGFIRPHAVPAVLEQNHLDYLQMAEVLTMVQDFNQIEAYDDKSAQFWRWGKWMPQTWRFDNRDRALAFARAFPVEGHWIVSKADVGASSKNVRVLRTRKDLLEHIRQAFGPGIEVDHCAGGGPNGRHSKGKQKGYVLLQEFIPNDMTWRVNAIGRGRALFRRFNGPDGKAQTGNVEPVMDLDSAVTQAVLEFANRIFHELNTKWCALDILHDVNTGRLYLLETSVGWPWPSPGRCNEGAFFGNIERPRRWIEMWDLMFDEYEAGVWTAERTEPSTTSA